VVGALQGFDPAQATRGALGGGAASAIDTAASPTSLAVPSQPSAPRVTAQPGEGTKQLETDEQSEFLTIFNGLTPQQQEKALEDPDIRAAFQEAQGANGS